MGGRSGGGGRSSRGRASPAAAQKKPKAKDTIRLLGHVDRKIAAAELKRHGLSVKKLRDAIGATKGSKLVITDAGGGVIKVQVTTAAYKLERTLVMSKTKGKYIKNEFFQAFKTKTGIGAKIFARQVKKASKLGYTRIVTDAAGRKGSNYNGYYTWARFGYNSRLGTHKYSLPAPYNTAKTIQGVMRMKGGREAWKEHGGMFYGTFDLRKGSKSRKILSAYLKEQKNG